MRAGNALWLNAARISTHANSLAYLKYAAQNTLGRANGLPANAAAEFKAARGACGPGIKTLHARRAPILRRIGMKSPNQVEYDGRILQYNETME
jgi:hypothetical protein